LIQFRYLFRKSHVSNSIVARLLLLAIIFISFTNNVHAQLAQPQENKSYCQPDSPIVIFLVDITTPYDQTDKDAIVRTTDDILSSLKGGEKLVIRTIGDSYTHSERLIERCVPSCPAQGEMARLLHCSDGVIRTDLERVRADVINALKKRLANFAELKHSDIVRTINSVVNEETNKRQHLVLYIYSDLIENSDYFSTHYLFTYSVSRLINGLKIYKLIPDLKGAEVHVSGVGRNDTKDRRPLSIIQLNKLTEFWKAYFKECGATTITISPD
jgi:hypothetical protein